MATRPASWSRRSRGYRAGRDNLPEVMGVRSTGTTAISYALLIWTNRQAPALHELSRNRYVR